MFTSEETATKWNRGGGVRESVADAEKLQHGGGVTLTLEIVFNVARESVKKSYVAINSILLESKRKRAK